jgi:triacylglycerol lipase
VWFNHLDKSGAPHENITMNTTKNLHIQKYTAIAYIALFVSLFSVINCSSINAKKANTVTIEQAPLKYPVVLVHGIAASDRKDSIIDFWGRIPTILTDNGVKVFFGNTEPWGSYESNAEILKATIEKILLETNKEKVNIIAHTKGGIDSRYLIWKYDFGDKVASLTTISTPHHGAELADLIYKQKTELTNLIYKQKIVHTKIAKEALESFSELFTYANTDVFDVNYELTTEKMKEFNEKVVMDDRVYYQSLYTTMNNSFDDLTFFYTHWYIKKAAGGNDGVVSENSAKWGKNVVKIKCGISHTEIVDFKKRKISGIDIPNIYINIINQLSKKGF